MYTYMYSVDSTYLLDISLIRTMLHHVNDWSLGMVVLHDLHTVRWNENSHIYIYVCIQMHITNNTEYTDLHVIISLE